MKLDMLLYGLDDTATIDINNEKYELIATGTDSDIYAVAITYDTSRKKYVFWSVEQSPFEMLFEADELRHLFELFVVNGHRIAWDERRMIADELIDEFSTSINTADLYAEAILDLEDEGEIDTREIREAFENKFCMDVEDAL